MSTAHESLAPGSMLKDKYEIEERLGAGGMAVVYRARNVAVDREVAIKVLDPKLAENETAVQRFKREAKAANQARHPNIVDVLDVDQDGDLLFIVQEYLEGEDLAERLKREKRLPPSEALAIMVSVAEGVAAAHEKSVIHRDLKPENIFLVKSDHALVPKILDFGISKMPLTDFRGTAPGGPPVKLRGGRITVAGMAMGTPYYMSPEQIRDPGTVDRRTDVWSIGVILYEMLSGEMPFDADDLGGLFARIHTHEPRHLDRFVPGVSAALSRVVERCLQVKREARYESAVELARALRAVGEDAPDLAGGMPRSDGREAFAATRVSAEMAAPALELDVSGQSAASEPGVSTREASEGQVPPAPTSSGQGFALELDLPPPSHPSSGGASSPGASSRGASSPGAPSDPGPAAPPGSGLGFDIADDDSDDDMFPGMDLAVEPPRASSRRGGHVRKPRVTSSTAERGPESRRRIHMRQHAKRKLAGSYVRLLLGAAFVASLALGTPYLTPIGVQLVRDELGGRLLFAYGGAAVAGIVVLVVTLVYALRLGSYGLYLASAGIAVTVVGLGGALVIHSAPGLVPANVVTVSLLAAPYAAMTAVAGFVLFAFGHGRELRDHDDERLLGNVLLVAALLGAGALAWMVRSPRASLVAIQRTPPPLAAPVREEVRAVAADLQGGRIPAVRPLPLRANDVRGRGIGHVTVDAEQEE
jgi:serine/threonine-protein kinase